MKVLVLMSPPLFARLEELDLALLDDVPGDGAELGVLPDLVGRAGADRGPVNIHVRLLAHVEPDDRPVLYISSLSLCYPARSLPCLGVDGPGDLLQRGLEAGEGGLAAAVDLVAGHSPEVGHAGYRVPELNTVVRNLLQGISKFFATSRNSFMFSSCNCVSLR